MGRSTTLSDCIVVFSTDNFNCDCKAFSLNECKAFSVSTVKALNVVFLRLKCLLLSLRRRNLQIFFMQYAWISEFDDGECEGRGRCIGKAHPQR